MRRLHPRRILLAALLAALFFPPRAARADVRTEARQHFRQGMALIAEGKTEEGVRELEAAYALLPHPSVLFNIGRAYAEAGDLDRAEDYLKRYLDTDPADRSETERLLAELEARKAEAAKARPAAAPAGAARPDGTPASGPGATADEIATLQASARQLEALAEVTQSETLRERAQRLKALAGTLEARAAVAPAPASLGQAAAAPAADGPAVAEASPADVAATDSLETLLLQTAPEIGTQVYEEQVVSASRFASSPLDAPYSTSIVTAQDIRLSGLTSIPDLLRRVAGVDVMTLTPGDTEVSIRGLNQRLSNKVLVLVDGRSVYLDFLGATLWATLPVSVDDIDRIEVIRGPASALYGADAVTGIVNIITRDPGEGGSHVTAGGGDAAQALARASVAGRNDRGLSWRFGGGFAQANQYSLPVGEDRLDVAPFSSNPDLGRRRIWANLEARQRLGGGWEARGGTAASTFDLSFQAISRLRELWAQDGVFDQTFLSLSSPFGLSIQGFYNYFQVGVGNAAAVPGGIPIEAKDIRSQVADVEATWQGRFHAGVEHELALGVGYRLKSISWAWLDRDHYEHHLSAFLEDTMRFGDLVQLAVSARVDRHPLLDGPQFSPRGSLVIRPTRRSAVRATFGTAFRSPTFLESYLHIANETPLRGVTAYGQGNLDLAPENMMSAEVGYSQEIGDVAALEANAYYNVIKDEILLSRIEPYRLQDHPGYDGGAQAFPVGELVFSNENAEYRQLGGELGARVYPLRGLDVYANYAFNDTRPVDPNADLGGRELDRRTPPHKVNAGLQYRAALGLDLGFDLHYVDRQVWVEQVTDPVMGVRFQSFDVPAYLLVDARVGYRLLSDDLELGLVVTNLLDQRHREHPFGQLLGRRILGTASVRF